MEHKDKVEWPEVPEQESQEQLERNKGFGDMPGQVLSDGYRVKHRRNAKYGTVRRVMSDGRSRVRWDDRSESVERPDDLDVIGKEYREKRYRVVEQIEKTNEGHFQYSIVAYDDEITGELPWHPQQVIRFMSDGIAPTWKDAQKNLAASVLLMKTSVAKDMP